MSTTIDTMWKVGDEITVKGTGGDIYRPEFLATIEEHIKSIDEELRGLSLDISGLVYIQ
jgi:hypothetical protein